jgi:hypothetical protein
MTDSRTATHADQDESGSRRLHGRFPTTRLGKWSFWLAVAFIVGFGINSMLVGVVGTSTDATVNEFSRTYLPFWGIALFTCGAAAGVLGLIAMLKSKERSVFTLLAVLPLLFVAVFLLGELLVPH